MKVKGSSILEVVLSIAIISIAISMINHTIFNMSNISAYPREENANQKNMAEFRRQIFLRHHKGISNENVTEIKEDDSDTLGFVLYGIKGKF